MLNGDAHSPYNYNPTTTDKFLKVLFHFTSIDDYLPDLIQYILHWKINGLFKADSHIWD